MHWVLNAPSAVSQDVECRRKRSHAHEDGRGNIRVFVNDLRVYEKKY